MILNILIQLLILIAYCDSDNSIPAGHVKTQNSSDVNLKYLKNAKEFWFFCKKDEDCSIAHGYCASPVAVNKNYSLDVTGHIGNPDHCVDYRPPNWPDGALCENNKCVLKDLK